jgi:membrane-associated phospholipid phosphatase
MKPIFANEGRRPPPAAPPLTPFVYTSLEFDNSPLQLAACAASTLPLLLLASLFALLASRRDLHTAALLCGLVLNQLLNHGLKVLIAAPRPQPTVHPAFDAVSPHGWPSDHAQFMGFLLAFACLWAPRRWRAPPRLRAACVGLLAAAAAAVAASRVALRYHSAGQAAAGLAVGGAAGGAWHGAVEALLRPRFAALAASQWGRWAMVVDCSNVNVMAEEYAALSAAGKRHAPPAHAGSGGGGRGGGAYPGAAVGLDEGKGFV